LLLSGSSSTHNSKKFNLEINNKKGVQMLNRIITLIAIATISTSCARPSEKVKESSLTKNNKEMSSGITDTITLGGGCYWCVEAIYQELKGVESVASGFSGGARDNPSYEQVCSGATGHAEVVQIVFDPKQVAVDELLEVFWSVHDPTTLNRQGADIGTQYRSVIFYHNLEQKEIAEKYKKKLNDEHTFDNPVVTEISAFTKFFKADEYHQNYYKENSDQPYCTLVIRPKLDKFQKVFKDKLKGH
jgi:peptide-methionine (S)-S-oxide reductase